MVKSPANALRLVLWACLTFCGGALIAAPAQAQNDATPSDNAPVAAPVLAVDPATANEAGDAPVPSAPALPPARAASFVASEPAASPIGTAAPVNALTPASAPASIAAPVDANPLPPINPESIGLIGGAEGGLGGDMWKNTPRALIDRLLPTLTLPTASITLNDLARRFLLTAAAVPDRAAADAALAPSLTGVRATKLLALGDLADAWKLLQAAKGEQINDNILQQAAEAGLVSDAADDICGKMPDLMKNRTTADWQKLLAVCQLKAKNFNEAQISIDLLRTQGLHDDAFFDLAEKNVIGGGKQLPRQLTPVKPVMLALLQLSGQPLRAELYARPDAGLIPALLKTRSLDEKARLALAERAAARGLIDSGQLLDAYKSAGFTPDELATAANNRDNSPRLRAMLAQNLVAEKDNRARLAIAGHFLQSAEADGLTLTEVKILAGLVSDIQPAADYNLAAPMMVRVFAISGDHAQALGWLKQAKIAATGLPDIAAQLQNIWPLLVLSGFEADSDYAKDLSNWLDAMLKPQDVNPSVKTDPKAQTNAATNALLLLDAAGFTVSDDAFIRVADAPDYVRRTYPDDFTFERLRASGSAKRRGEAVLYGLLAAGGTDLPSLVVIDTTRALRQSGLTAEAASLAMETMMRLPVAIGVKP